MRVLVLALFTLSNAFALECANFSAEVAKMDRSEKVSAAHSCKELYISKLKKSIRNLDDQELACRENIESLQELAAQARSFYHTAIDELKSEHVDPAVEQQIRDTMVDTIFALSKRIEQRDCAHIEYVEAKADAQVEVLLLEETRLQEANV